MQQLHAFVVVSTGDFLKCHLCNKLNYQYLIFSSILNTTEAVKIHGERSVQHRRGYDPQQEGYKMLDKRMDQDAVRPCSICHIE